MDIQNFPFDVQTCTLKFTSWTFSMDELDIVTGSPDIDLSEFMWFLFIFKHFIVLLILFFSIEAQ